MNNLDNETPRLPAGLDGAEVKGNSKKSNLEFYGLKLHRFHKPGGWTKLIGKRTFENGEPHRIYEIDVCKGVGEGCCNYSRVYENDNQLFYINGTRLNQAALEYVTVAALYATLKNRCRRNKTHRKEDENA